METKTELIKNLFKLPVSSEKCRTFVMDWKRAWMIAQVWDQDLERLHEKELKLKRPMFFFECQYGLGESFKLEPTEDVDVEFIKDAVWKSRPSKNLEYNTTDPIEQDLVYLHTWDKSLRTNQELRNQLMNQKKGGYYDKSRDSGQRDNRGYQAGEFGGVRF